jgi:hypothetical protein
VTTAAQRVLNSFEALSEAEQKQAASEVLRRVLDSSPPAFSDEALVEAAEALFLEFDTREAAHAGSRSG